VVVGSTWGRVALVLLWVLSKREHTCSWLCQAEKWSGHLFPSVESCFSMVDTRRIIANWNYTHSWAGPHIATWGRGHYTCAAVCWLAGYNLQSISHWWPLECTWTTPLQYFISSSWQHWSWLLWSCKLSTVSHTMQFCLLFMHAQCSQTKLSQITFCLRTETKE